MVPKVYFYLHLSQRIRLVEVSNQPRPLPLHTCYLVFPGVKIIQFTMLSKKLITEALGRYAARL